MLPLRSDLHNVHGCNLHMLSQNIQADEVSCRLNLLTWSIYLEDKGFSFIAAAVNTPNPEHIPKGICYLLLVTIPFYFSVLPS